MSTANNIDLSPIICPETAGANEVSIPRPFTRKHYTQEDTSLNKTLWDLFPSNFMGVMEDTFEEDIKHNRAQTQYTHSGEYVLKSLETTIPKYERYSIGANMVSLVAATNNACSRAMCLPVIATSVVDLHFHMLADVNHRKKTSKVDPVPLCVDAAKAHKEAGNDLFKQGKWGEAVVEYVRGLFKLYPWACSPLIFSSDDAFAYGVAPLECGIWGNIAAAALKIHDVEPEMTNVPPGLKAWARLATHAATAVIHMRYATLNQLSKAYLRLSTAAKIITENDPIGIPRGLPTSVMCDRFASTDVKKLMFASILISAAKGDKDAWAHAHCVTKHNGCGCDEVIYPDWEGNQRVYKATPHGRRVFSLNISV